jgi:hypothetical protein
MAQMVSCWIVTIHAWFQSHACVCWICGEQSGMRTGFSPVSIVLILFNLFAVLHNRSI